MSGKWQKDNETTTRFARNLQKGTKTKTWNNFLSNFYYMEERNMMNWCKKAIEIHNK